MKKQLWNTDWTFRAEGGEPVPVTLPHDAMQAVGRAPGAPSGQGGAYYLGGRYVYEKKFTLTEQEAAGSFCVLFDGVYRKALVSLNGHEAARVPYGYRPFTADGTGLVHPGENVIQVEVDDREKPDSRWYSGAGIYRSVWLLIGGKCCIAPHGVKVSTLSIDPPTVKVEVSHTGGKAEVEIWDGEILLARAEGDCVELPLPGAKLWSAEEPNLYRCRAVLRQGGEAVDEAETDFGIRTLRYDNTGFYVNGQRTLLRGGCLHHDNGILGACSIPEAEERRLRILKQAGFNAIRCSHNPASADLLGACDKLGIYVMEELWDMWYQRKNKCDYGADFRENWADDVRTVVERDFSHPSVIMYSIGNEVTEPHNEEGVQMGREIVDLFHQLDQTRPTTVGLNMALLAMSAMGAGLYDNVDAPPQDQAPAANSTVFNKTVSRNDNLMMASRRPEVAALSAPMLDAVDIAGYNYGAPRYPLDKTEYPNRVVVGSETFCHQLAATWKVMAECPHVIGDFMWTAWDYIGECGIGAWSAAPDALEFGKPYPWKLADTGAFDLIGTPTGEALWASAVWKGETSIGVQPVPYPAETLARGAWRGTNAVPSWSWRGCEGKEATVEVYTPWPTVELFLNGASLGQKTADEMRSIFTVPYEPGTLEAAAFDESGAERARARLETVQGELSWTIGCEARLLRPGQVAFFPIALQGENGMVECNADAPLELQVIGGRLLGFGSAEPRTEAEFTTGHYPSCYGRALAAVEAGKGSCVEMKLYSSGELLAQERFAIMR